MFKYQFYYNKDKHVSMSGDGLIKAIIEEEEYTIDQCLEGLVEELGELFPMYNEEKFEIGIYVGNSTYFTYDIMIDYNCETPDHIIDPINDWLNKNTIIKELVI